MSVLDDSALVDLVRRRAITHDLTNELVSRIGERRIVMLGESTHGTHEFYEWRRRVTVALLRRNPNAFVAVEGDWPACANVRKYIRAGGASGARQSLEGFRRWPTWMWANLEILKLIEELRALSLRGFPHGLYGLDVYSLFESMEAVIRQTERVDPLLAKRLRAHYACFDPFSRDERAYAKSLLGVPEGCERAALDALRELLRARALSSEIDGERLFDAAQNARIVADAENYYRTMMLGNEDSWNVRDRHMMDTLNRLLVHHGPDSQAIVWAHNTHIGDYRATDMAGHGLVNLGGLAREEWGESAVFLVGLSTYEGAAVSSKAWEGRVERQRVPPAKPGTVEAAFHKAGFPECAVVFEREDRRNAFADMRGQRAIGVVYDPAYEHFSNYSPTSLAKRYDAFVFWDRSIALTPIELEFDRNELPETWPAGF